MIKFEKIFNSIKRKLGFKNKSKDVVVNIEFYLESDMSELTFEIPISDDDDKTQMKKPPIGLLPKKIFDNFRLVDIHDAVNRYFFDKKEIPIEWIEEYNELVKKVRKENVPL